ncbi:MAG: alpha/beta hydrolase, partial [Aerococcus viridans]
MSKKDNNRLWRLGLAAAATGVGYVYHAMSQERSLRSKVIQDGMRIKREANRLTPANSKKQATEDLAKRSINHENLFFITRDQSSEIHRGKNGVMVELTDI